MNYFQGNKDHPQHISVGAILQNQEGLICVHHFPEDHRIGYWQDHGIREFYILMRESIEPNETLEAALHRGLKEEFNAIASLDDYLGSIVSTFTHQDGGPEIEKTTLYFLCTFLKDAALNRDPNDEESSSVLEWKRAEDLIPLMKAQRERFGRDDLDESAILERYLEQR
jgi:hypothetical protein